MRCTKSRLKFVSLLACFLMASPVGIRAAEPASGDWPQWRGPNRDSQIEAKTLPEGVSESLLRPKWRIPLGPSYSGPVVSEDRVFVTETKDKTFEVVRAFDRTSGEQIWETQWEGAMQVPFFAMANGSWIRATPAYDGERLYVAGMRDLLVCIDADTGKQLWQVDFVKQVEAPLPSFGFASSPLVDGDYVYVQAGACLAKVNKMSGEIVWRALKDDGGMSGSAFSSPIVASLNGKQQIVVQTRTKLAGVGLDNGELIWSVDIPAFRGMNILTPTVIGNSVFTSSYGGQSLIFSIEKTADAYVAKELWKNRSQGYMSSPVVIDGHVYIHLRNQRFTCIALSTGETKWTTKPFGKYWSMVASGDQILALDERGELLLINATPEKFDLVDRRKISEEPTWAHIAVSGHEIFVRELGAIQAFRWSDDSKGERSDTDRDDD